MIENDNNPYFKSDMFAAPSQYYIGYSPVFNVMVGDDKNIYLEYNY